jgi:hypothetical protein
LTDHSIHDSWVCVLKYMKVGLSYMSMLDLEIVELFVKYRWRNNSKHWLVHLLHNDCFSFSYASLLSWTTLLQKMEIISFPKQTTTHSHVSCIHHNKITNQFPQHHKIFDESLAYHRIFKTVVVPLKRAWQQITSSPSVPKKNVHLASKICHHGKCLYNLQTI